LKARPGLRCRISGVKWTFGRESEPIAGFPGAIGGAGRNLLPIRPTG
jgi:hypothetical protein